MNNNFYSGSNQRRDENIQNRNDDVNNQPPQYNQYDGYNQTQPTQNNQYGGYQNQSQQNNQYSGYNQNQPQQYNQYGAYNHNQSQQNNQYGAYNHNQSQQNNQYGAYNQNQSPQNNAYGFYGQNNNYQNNGYGNYNNSTGYNNQGVSDGYQSFNDSLDPPGAEHVYINERKGLNSVKAATIVFVVFFLLLAGYTVFCNASTINAVLVEKIIPIGVLLFVSVFSLYLALQPTINTIRKKPRCTHSVIAKIVDVKSRRNNNGGRTYFPTYKYSYMGKIYIIAAAKNMSLTPPYVGKELEMFINPNNPEEYYIDTKVINIISLVVGGFFFITTLQFLIPTIFS